MLRRYAEYFSSLRRRTVYTAHGWFVDLQRHGASKIKAVDASSSRSRKEKEEKTTQSWRWFSSTNNDNDNEAPRNHLREAPRHEGFMRRSGELHHHSFVRYRPVYVGTMRDPLRRLLSHYNYLHSGPRSLTRGCAMVPRPAKTRRASSSACARRT